MNSILVYEVDTKLNRFKQNLKRGVSLLRISLPKKCY